MRRPAVRRRHGQPVCPAIRASDAITRPLTAPRHRRPLFISVLIQFAVFFISLQPHSFVQSCFVVAICLCAAVGLQPGGRRLQ